MVNKTNLSAFAYKTNKKFTCIAVTSHNFIFDKIKILLRQCLAISKSLLDVSFIPGTPEYRNTYKKTFFVTY